MPVRVAVLLAGLVGPAQAEGEPDPRAISVAAAFPVTEAPEPSPAGEPRFSDVTRESSLPEARVSEVSPGRAAARAPETPPPAVPPGAGNTRPGFMLAWNAGLGVNTHTIVGVPIGATLGLLWPTRHFGFDVRVEANPLLVGVGVISDCATYCPSEETGGIEWRLGAQARLGTQWGHTFHHAILAVDSVRTQVAEGGHDYHSRKFTNHDVWYVGGGVGYGLLRRVGQYGLVGFENTLRLAGRVTEHEFTQLKPKRRFSSDWLAVLGVVF